MNQGTTFTLAAARIVDLMADVDGDAVSTELVTGPGHGTLIRRSDGSFAFTPDITYVGCDQIVVRVTDGQFHSENILVRFTIEAAITGTPPNTNGQLAYLVSLTPPPIGVSAADANGSTTANGRGATSANFGVAGEEEAIEFERARPRLVGNPPRADFPGSEKDAPQPQPVVVARTDVLRPAFDDRWYATPTLPPTAPVVRFETHLWQQQTVQLFQDLDKLADNLAQANASRHESVLIVGSVTATLTSGYILWQLRTFYLLLSALAARPLWRNFDPLVLLESDDDDDVEKMFD